MVTEISSSVELILGRAGFNIIRRINASRYDAEVPPERRTGRITKNARTVLLAGFAGKEFWAVLNDFIKDNPEFYGSTEDIIDDYTVLQFKKVGELLYSSGVEFETVFPFGPSYMALDFVKLGALGGVGVPSLLGVLINPVYGPWISLRGAILTDIELDAYDAPLDDFDPCPACSKPCIDACPAKTISHEGWDYRACLDYRHNSEDCGSSCASRRACPYGAEHQYGEQQLTHHQGFALQSYRRYTGLGK
ncbi:MAG: hypothetical protein V3U74_06995 [Thermodesulfobacteriota bacterium]